MAPIADDLLARFRAADPDARSDLIRSLAGEDARVAGPVLLVALDDPWFSVRHCAASSIAWVKPAGAVAALVRAFESAQERLGAKPPDLLQEEEDLLSALISQTHDRGLASAVARIARRVVNRAGNKYAYDPDNHTETGRFAAELLALTGVPRDLVPELEAAAAAPGLAVHVREQLEQAVARSRR